MVTGGEHIVEHVPFFRLHFVIMLFFYFEDILLDFGPGEGLGCIGVDVLKQFIPGWIVSIVGGGGGGRFGSGLIVVTVGVVIAAVGITGIVNIDVTTL